MSDDIKHIIISLAAFAGIFGIIYEIVTARHRERIAMIERGVDASIFVNRNQTISHTLKYGMFFVGIALGIILENILNNYYFLDRPFTIPAMMFLFGGLSLIANFLVERKLSRKE